MHCKYSLNGHPCFADVMLGHSCTWKRMLSVQGVEEQHITWILNSGSSNFCHDNWLVTGPLFKQVEFYEEYVVLNYVENGGWSLQWLYRVLPAGWVHQVLKISPPCSKWMDTVL